VLDAFRDRDAPRLREAAHKLSGMVAAFSSLAGTVASELEEHAAENNLEAAEPLVKQLETMARQLMQVVDALSIDSLWQQTAPAGEPGQAVR
jgi:hypothetical protein